MPLTLFHMVLISPASISHIVSADISYWQRPTLCVAISFASMHSQSECWYSLSTSFHLVLISWPHSPHSGCFCPLLTSLHIANADIPRSRSTKYWVLPSPVPIPHVLSADIFYLHLSTLWELISPVSIPTFWVLISSGPLPPKISANIPCSHTFLLSVLISPAPIHPNSECWYPLSTSTHIVTADIPWLHLSQNECCHPLLPHFSTVCWHYLSPPPTLWLLISPVHILPPSENLYSMVSSST